MSFKCNHITTVQLVNQKMFPAQGNPAKSHTNNVKSISTQKAVTATNQPVILPSQCKKEAESDRHHDHPERIQIELRIPDREMAKQIMLRTIQLLQDTASSTGSEGERKQALECIKLIKRDNPSLQICQWSNITFLKMMLNLDPFHPSDDVHRMAKMELIDDWLQRVLPKFWMGCATSVNPLLQRLSP